MNKRTLIYMPEDRVIPVGGPQGYLYNLKQELDKRKGHNIEFLPAIKKSSKQVSSNKYVIKLKRIWKSIMYTITQYRMLYGNKHVANIDLNNYDIIHFHDTWSMFCIKDSLKDFKGTIILTSHSPMILSKELYQEASNLKKRLFRKMLEHLIIVDEYSFQKADILIFPCEEAEEPYIHSWDKFDKLKRTSPQKFIYNPTGIIKKNQLIPREQILRKYGIPNDAIIFSYAGRHNYVKGYDELKVIGQEFLNNHPNVYFLVAGVESPLTGLKHERWIEIGWTNDPHSVIAASDAFVLPNKETYFDLVLLEVLSLGTPIIASKTGGNRFFSKWKDSGIFLYKNRKEAITYMENICSLSSDQKNKYRKLNTNIFENNFTIALFTDRYLKILEAI